MIKKGANEDEFALERVQLQTRSPIFFKINTKKVEVLMERDLLELNLGPFQAHEIIKKRR